MEAWIIGVILALFVIIPCWLALSRRRQVQLQVEAWPELAQRTGLIFDPNIFNAPKAIDHYPGLRGEYRGRALTVKLFGDSEANTPPNTWISLSVQNDSHVSLSIRAKTAQDSLHKNPASPSGSTKFDRYFRSEGAPHEYLQGAIRLIEGSDPRLLGWILRNFPTIELKEGTLLCSQNGELTHVDDQIAFLDLLCDLAELAEQRAAPAVISAEAGTKNDDWPLADNNHSIIRINVTWRIDQNRQIPALPRYHRSKRRQPCLGKKASVTLLWSAR